MGVPVAWSFKGYTLLSPMLSWPDLPTAPPRVYRFCVAWTLAADVSNCSTIAELTRSTVGDSPRRVASNLSSDLVLPSVVERGRHHKSGRTRPPPPKLRSRWMHGNALTSCNSRKMPESRLR